MKIPRFVSAFMARANNRSAAVLVAIALGAAACGGSSGADEAPNEEVACEDVESALTAAEEEVSDAEKRYEDVKGTPDGDEARDDLKAAKSKVDQLENQAEACDRATTTTTTVPESECSTPVECLEEKVNATDGTEEEEAREGELLDMAKDAEAVAKERSYGLGNTTCEKSCVLRNGIKGDTAEDMAVELLAKGVMSPPLLDDAARYLVAEYGDDTYTDNRPVGDLHKAADDLEIVFEFIDGSTASRGVLSKGTKRWNTVVKDGRVVQFEYTLRRDRVYIRFEKDGVALEFFDSCGNRTSDKPTPGVPEVPETEVPHDDKAPQDENCQQNGTAPQGQRCDGDERQAPADNDTSGVNVGPKPGAPSSPPPPVVRPIGDPDGGSGNGGAPPPTGPTDDSDADEVTEPPPPGEDPCPLGPGMCQD